MRALRTAVVLVLALALPVPVLAAELANGQMSYEEAARLAKVFDDVQGRRAEQKPVSDVEMNDAILFIGWAWGFAEATVYMELENEDQPITDCVEKHGYGFIPSSVASMFLIPSQPDADIQKHSVQPYAYAALAVDCRLLSSDGN